DLDYFVFGLQPGTAGRRSAVDGCDDRFAPEHISVEADPHQARIQFGLFLHSWQRLEDVRKWDSKPNSRIVPVGTVERARLSASHTGQRHQNSHHTTMDVDQWTAVVAR